METFRKHVIQNIAAARTAKQEMSRLAKTILSCDSTTREGSPIRSQAGAMPRSKSVPKKGLYENGNPRATTDPPPSPSVITPVSLSSALRSIRPLPTPPITRSASRSTCSSVSSERISKFPEDLEGTYTCQVVEPGMEGTEIIPTRK